MTGQGMTRDDDAVGEKGRKKARGSTHLRHDEDRWEGRMWRGSSGSRGMMAKPITKVSG